MIVAFNTTNIQTGLHVSTQIRVRS